jgi:hypothetical protein
MNARDTLGVAIEHARNAQALADLLRVGHHDEQEAGKVSAASIARAADVLHREVAAALDAMLDVQEAA